MIHLEELASVVASIQTSNSKTEMHNLTGALLNDNPNQIEDILKLCCSTPRDSVKPNHIVALITNCYGMFPEEYESLWDEKEIPLILADESPDEVESSLSLTEARQFKSSIMQGEAISLDVLFLSLSKTSARLFWGFCFGRTLINYRKVMAGVATRTSYSIERLQQARIIMPPHEVIIKALSSSLPTNTTIEPCYPFFAPRYSRWPYWSLPFKNTHYQIVGAEHYFAHRKSGRVFLFDRRGEKFQHEHPLIEGEEDCICEFDDDGNMIEWLYKKDAPEIWKEPRSVRCPEPKIIESESHLRRLVESLEQNETLRLIDGDRPYFHSGAVGGFIVPRRTFDLPLLILGGKRDSAGVRLKVGALDGFDIYPIGYAFVKEENLPDILTPLFESNIFRECREGLIGIFHALSFDTETNKLRAPYLTKIDTTLGISDAIQIGDLMERSSYGR
tara:strand:+ start:159 stop:1496 length:1338 start_codon:yes stop_codon:yes gene_type:complete